MAFIAASRFLDLPTLRMVTSMEEGSTCVHDARNVVIDGTESNRRNGTAWCRLDLN